MKLTKADRTRIAVSRKERGDGRSILYTNPEEKDGKQQTKSGMTALKIKQRVEQANRLYGVFFRFQKLPDVEKKFEKLVALGRNSSSAEGFYDKVLCSGEFRGFSNDRKKNSSESGKTYTYMDMYNYAGERLESSWLHRDFHRVAAKVMVCIAAGADTMKELKKLLAEKNGEELEIFLSACRKSSESVFISNFTFELENVFTILMKNMVRWCSYDSYITNDSTKIEKGIDKEINYLVKTTFVEKRTKGMVRKTLLSSLRFPEAEDDRMRAVLVRMRKTLKRGSNADIAIQLLQGLAQYQGNTFHDMVKSLNKNDRDNLRSFIDAVNRDYYKVNIEKSIRNINVKVQPDANTPGVLELSNSGHPKKGALKETLLRYAASADESDRVLIEIKSLLFDYFLPGDDRGKEEFTQKKKLWNIPFRTDIYFDYDEECDGEHEDIECLCEKAHIPQKRLKDTIRYVNYGKYLRLTQKETDPVKKYWTSFVKECVEKNYVETKKELSYQDCFATEMLMSCWKEIIRFLCGKYMDIGKAVYHFTNVGDFPKEQNNVKYGQVKEKYRKGISSFDYEGIKAEETLQRDIANVVVAAEAAFSRSVLAEAGKEETKDRGEDIFFMKLENMESFMKDDAAKQILRYFGGASTVEGAAYLMKDELVYEILELLKSIRNHNFHYTNGKQKEAAHELTDKLWDNDIKASQQLIRQRYYANNAGMFYPQEKIRNLVRKLYGHTEMAGAQIPAFRTILKKNTQSLNEFMTQWKIQKPAGSRQDMAGDFEGTLYFLLKVIYYRDFVVSDRAAEYFFEAVEVNKMQTQNEQDCNIKKAGESFSEYVLILQKKYKSGQITFEMICQYIMTEYNQQNTGKQEKEIYKHFKFLLVVCMRNAFGCYLKDTPEYQFLFRPKVQPVQGQQGYLDEVEIPCSIQKKHYDWYVLAHFLHPRQLNFLIGDFKSYIQYREDIVRRIRYAGEGENGEQQSVDENVGKAKDIVEVLEFVREVSGRVSNDIRDYYQNEEEYAEYLAQYIDFDKEQGNSAFEKLKNFCQKTVPGRIVDLYADAENPKVLRNVELARMYAGGDVKLHGRQRVTKADVQAYYQHKDKVVEIQAQDRNPSDDELDMVRKFQENKNRLTLTDVTDIFSMINDLLGRLISLSYLRERDEMYLLLGFYYMALQQKNQETNWPGETMDVLQVDSKNIHIGGGLVLNQIVSIFNYGSKLRYCNADGKWDAIGGQLSNKLGKFDSNHKLSLSKAIRLFENEKYDKDIAKLRNYVDHMKYYANQKHSIVDLYSEFHAKFFGYSSKLQKSVVYQLQMVLEKYFVDGGCVTFQGNRLGLKNELKSMKFTYKITAKKENSIISRKKDARSDKYLNEVKTALEYLRP